VLRPVYSDTTQLDVELSCVGEVSTISDNHAVSRSFSTSLIQCFLGLTLLGSHSVIFYVTHLPDMTEIELQ